MKERMRDRREREIGGEREMSERRERVVNISTTQHEHEHKTTRTQAQNAQNAQNAT